MRFHAVFLALAVVLSSVVAQDVQIPGEDSDAAMKQCQTICAARKDTLSTNLTCTLSGPGATCTCHCQTEVPQEPDCTGQPANEFEVAGTGEQPDTRKRCNDTCLAKGHFSPTFSCAYDDTGVHTICACQCYGPEITTIIGACGGATMTARSTSTTATATSTSKASAEASDKPGNAAALVTVPGGGALSALAVFSLAGVALLQ
ncbi:hypothetical protein BKA62DRAFT_829793 [Auriculariales sp. MPI-PUGE-AT-0066]|nr:hypothetical protein BKA62DRAFT_829793 [Auriculariales sp. MPI-PUGE-AT-0066]